jgi:demethylmenaquinone methyltransferase/2-methoxy-6-polyprenyl-1,4-benzoquinol methylase
VDAAADTPPSRGRSTAFAQRLFDGLPGRYDRLGLLLSFGQDRRWRRAMVDAVVAARPQPRTVLDVASGTAGVARQLARRTAARVVGVDLTEQMVRVGRRRVLDDGFEGRVTLTVGQAERLPVADGSVDALTVTYLLRYVADPGATVRELARAVRPGGVVSSLEFAVPEHPVWHPAWVFYTRTLLPLLGLVTGGPEWWRVGRFLGPSITEHYRRYPVAWQVRAWEDAGLVDVHTRRMSLGGGLVMWARKAEA